MNLIVRNDFLNRGMDSCILDTIRLEGFFLT